MAISRVRLERNKTRETSPERTKVWTEPKPKQDRKVPVIYYLCRNGQLEHPHFMEVNLSSSDGLHLKDVMNRLNLLRGKGMASMYAWSCKRSYKNGFVWHDLSENDLIYPAHGHEYVLKGSELQEPLSSSQELQDCSSESSQEISEKSTFPVNRKNNCSWGSLDLNEYKVYKPLPATEIAGKAAADASTQTDEKGVRRKVRMEEQQSMELNSEENENEIEIEIEISPPPSSSSPSPDTADQNETLESLIKADGHRVIRNLSLVEESEAEGGVVSSVKGKASTVLMQLISCGSISVKDHGLGLISQNRHRLTRGSNPSHGLVKSSVERELEYCLVENPRLAMEDKEYFSGSLIETKHNSGVAEIPSPLKRSSSYNADGSSKLDLAEKEIDGIRAKCIPRKTKSTAKKEINTISRSVHGSKRITEESVKPNPV